MKPYAAAADFELYLGDALDVLPSLAEASANCVVTSPPYYLLRDYGAPAQIGHEPTLASYVAALVEVFAEVRRVLRPDGVVWLNLGDTHCSAQRGPRHGRTSQLTTPERQERVSPVVNKRGRAPGVKPKDLFGVPFEVAFALRSDGWWLRQVVIWDKTNTVPESAKDRPTSSHEYVFLLAKSRRYWYDGDAIAEPATWERWGRQTNRKHRGQAHRKASYILDATREELADLAERGTRNARSVWRLNAAQFFDAHDAVMPSELAEKCILAGCPKGGLVLDPFAGAATSLVVAQRLGRRSIGIELSEEAAAAAARRLKRWWRDPYRPPAQPEEQASLLVEGAS